MSGDLFVGGDFDIIEIHDYRQCLDCICTCLVSTSPPEKNDQKTLPNWDTDLKQFDGISNREKQVTWLNKKIHRVHH